MILISLLLARIREKLGENNYLPLITNISEFVNSHKRCVIVYGESPENLRFMNPTITMYRDYFHFAVAKEEYSPEMCYDFPCFVPYQRGNPITDIQQPETTTASFLNWIDTILYPELKTISSMNALNDLLNGQDNVVFGVDLTEKPKLVSKQCTVYLVSSNLFRLFSVSLDPGLYLYRPVDREILPFSDLAEKSALEQSNLVPYSGIEESRRWEAGFALNESDSELCSEQYSILADLSREFTDVAFTTVNLTYFSDFVSRIGAESLHAPFFFVVDRTNPSRLRWITTRTDVEFLREYVRNILGYAELPFVVSEEVPEDHPDHVTHLVGRTFYDNVYDPSCDAFVLFTTTNYTKLKFFMPIYQAAAWVYENSSVRFFYIDIARNDIADGISVNSIPTMILFPRENKTDQRLYQGNSTFIDIVGFIEREAAVKPRRFNIYKVKKSLAAVIKKLRFG